MKRVLALVALAGCRQLLGFDEPSRLSDARGGDGRGSDGLGMPVCFQTTALGKLCVPALHSAALASSIDTDTDCDATTNAQSGLPLCLLAFDTLKVDSTIVFHGSRAPVLLAEHALAVAANGLLDVTSHDAGVAAPGVSCTSASGAADSAGGGGGAGGAFGAAGGNGGGGAGGAGGGIGRPGTSKPPFQGGCDGGAGGSNGPATGLGGRAGGALYLYSAASIDIDGVAIAYGIGGGGGSSSLAGGGGGGGGGGSGGMLAFDAPSVSIHGSAVLLATGGGGGGGGAPLNQGMPGNSPTLTQPSVAAAGGTAVSGGGSGGAGGVLADGSAGANGATYAGGGGGGGTGAIELLGPSAIIAGTVFPSPL